MMIFSGIYGVVDGFFVSNFAGKTPFAAVNLIIPFLMILGSVGFIFGAGGNAIVSNKLGEGRNELARQNFTLIVSVSIILGIVLGAIGFMVMRPVAVLFGATGELLENCVLYGRIIVVFVPAFIVQMEFQNFFVTAEKPGLGLASSVIAGVVNIILDALLVAVLSLGLIGAAAATAACMLTGAIIPLVYFSRRNKSLLRFTKTDPALGIIGKTITNGSSEFMNAVAMSVISILYNLQLLKYAGENGVAAYGVLMYVSMIFSAVYFGYDIGISPVVGFHFGAGNYDELKELLRKSVLLTAAAALFMFVSSELLAYPFSRLFVGYDAELLALTRRGFVIYSFAYLFMGFGIFGSSFFTALNDGLISALIAFIRTFIFQIGAVLLLPMIWGIDGIWYSLVAAEAMAMLLSAIFLFAKRRKYHLI